MKRSFALRIPMLAFVLLAGCGGETTTEPLVAVSLAIISGDSQDGEVGDRLAEDLVVRAVDREGGPVSGVSVTWAVTAGNGTITPTEATTGSDGTARAGWTPGSVGENRVEARAAGLTGSPARFTALATLANQDPFVAGEAATTASNASVTLDVLGNDSDPDGDPLTVQGVSAPAHGTALAAGDGTVTYTPSAGFTGEDSFTYTITDGRGGSAVGTVAITVVPDYSAGLPSDATTAVLYKFEELAPGISGDSSGGGHDGIDEGTTVLTGPWGLARAFDGVDDRIDMDAARVVLQGATSLTMEFLVRSAAGINPPGLVSHGCTNGWYLHPRAQTVESNLKTSSAGGICAWNGGFQSKPAPILDLNWHHFALVWDGSDLSTYRDGILLGSHFVSGTFSGAKYDGPWLGYNSFSNAWQTGSADEVRFSTNARDSTEMALTWKSLTWNWPALTGLPPVEVADGATVTLTGLRLDEVARVMVGGSEATIISQSPLRITFSVPAGLDPGSHDVMIETEDGRWDILPDGYGGGP